MSNIGAHVSIAGGIYNAPKNAAVLGCECFQMFTRSPRGGPAPVLDKKIVEVFQANCRSAGIKNYYVHTPYYINLASSKERVRQASIQVIRQELDRASLLGAKALMTHLGSSRDMGRETAEKEVIVGIKKILAGYQGSSQFLIENSAGAGGTVIGSTFEEIARIIKAVPGHNIGVCFDTCHAFVSGYDLRTPQAAEKVLRKFNKLIGLKKLKLIHANDSKAELGSHLDRHEHIGLGKIGKQGFKYLLSRPALKKVDFILETPDDGRGVDDINTLKGLRP